MKKAGTIIFSVAGWVLIAAFFAFAAVLCRDYREQLVVDRLEVEVTDAERLGFVTPEIITDFVRAKGLDPVGKKPSREMTAAIDSIVESYNFVERSNTYFDYGGKVTVELTQRRPILRLVTDDLYDLYLTADGYVLPVEGAAVRLPIVTGRFSLPFPRNYTGRLSECVDENEKNSGKSYLFLCKLINFVDWLQDDRYWREKIVQIVVTEPRPKHSGGIDEFPELELIPRDGNYTVVMGTVDDYRDKLSRWRAYAESGLLADGQRVVVKYRGQVVCSNAGQKNRNEN